MADEDIRMLLQAILDYFRWLKDIEQPQGKRLTDHYGQILIDFVIFSINKDIPWKDMFTFDTFREFRNYTDLKNTSHAIITLSSYLQEKGRIPDPLLIPNYQVQLPHIYEQYLRYLQQSKGVSKGHVRLSRRVLASFHDYLNNHNISLSALKIQQLDAFLSEFNKPFSPNTRRSYRCRLRDFLRYLYYEQRILKKDLAPLLVGPKVFTQSKPPRFLYPEQIQKLFASLKINTPSQIRTYAMVHIAYTLGLRPVEISKITLDDICFKKAQLSVRYRKTNNPVILPIPEQTLKAIALYLLKVRPQTAHRELFLTLHAPYRPVTSAVVIYHISKALKQAGLCATAYWLRHTYAQNLLQAGRSIYEIKEMLGHDHIDSIKSFNCIPAKPEQ